MTSAGGRTIGPPFVVTAGAQRRFGAPGVWASGSRGDAAAHALDVVSEAVEIVAEARLDGVEPGLLRVVVGVDTAHLGPVVPDLLEDQRVHETRRLVPVGCLAGLERDQLDRVPCCRGARQHRGGGVRVVSVPLECVLELVVGQ